MFHGMLCDQKTCFQMNTIHLNEYIQVKKNSTKTKILIVLICTTKSVLDNPVNKLKWFWYNDNQEKHIEKCSEAEASEYLNILSFQVIVSVLESYQNHSHLENIDLPTLLKQAVEASGFFNVSRILCY